LILGSCFGGSLLALILARAGKSVLMVDRSQHPRFAIGESSTPLADRTLAQLADRYGVPELRPFCHWGSWKRAHPQLMCGRKRGFTYFDQTDSEKLLPENFAQRRMLVSASVDDEHSDTHWLRSHVDQYLFELAISSGVTAFQKCTFTLIQQQDQWLLNGEGRAACGRERQAAWLSKTSDPLQLQAPFVVDATGSANGVLRHLGIADQTDRLRTNSRSLFAHFGGTLTSEQVLDSSGIETNDFPYRCDDAAVHQVLPDGWMWQLRYDDNSLSAGFMIDERPSAAHVSPTFATPAEEWSWRIERTPFLEQQFREAKILRPASGLQSTKRIQRLTSKAAGQNWAAITNTAGFIDPLHSSGIAHTLFAVSRLADILLTATDVAERRRWLHEYSETLISEICCIDELVEGCYEAIPSFPLWCLWGMLYFAASTSMEQSVPEGLKQVSFLRANDVAFRAVLSEARQRLGIARHAAKSERKSAEKEFANWLKAAIQPWNHVGLFDDSCNGLYSQTAAPADAW
jgi:tetracycline 7-halogenase / FADH2 O2-dependent halogenase